jgi:hypothetical protein
VNEYTASNGVTVYPLERGLTFRFPDIGQSKWGINQEKVEALREFFRAEEDERLGRWRWPKNAGYIVYPDARYPHLVSVIDESTGLREVRSKSKAGHKRDNFERAAAAYFDAHPEPKPKPWADAEYGDVWRFRTGDDRRHALAWRAHVSWDLIDPRGRGITDVSDPIEALIANGDDEFATAIAERLVPEVQS